MSMHNTICWTDISVGNLDRAITFYSAVLGSPVSKESAPGMEFGLLPHADNNASGCLVVSPDYPPSTSGPLVYFSVEGRLDVAIKAVTDHGGKILIEKHSIGPHGFRAVILDSEGNRIALHSHAA
ncbi:MAG: Glyoxalase/bleomycin resistance protein/dioxygenase [Planctomycetaceae bacterium]|nr:Glyoxalase/bleomycin resistance protein/dioxygenase [Planctomycetaceae bacterium]